MAKARITDKKLKNKRFRQTEESIILAFCTAKDTLSISRLIRLARISRSTLHRHHGSVYDIAPNYEQYIFSKYNRVVQHLLSKNAKPQHTLYVILTFIRNHRQIIDFILKYGDNNFIERMVSQLKFNSTNTHRVVREDILYIYIREVSSIIEQWVAGGCIKQDIASTIKKIIYLTETANSRLTPLTTL